MDAKPACERSLAAPGGVEVWGHRVCACEPQYRGDELHSVPTHPVRGRERERGERKEREREREREKENRLRAPCAPRPPRLWVILGYVLKLALAREISPATAVQRGRNQLQGSKHFRTENGSSQGQNLALTVLCVQNSLDSGRPSLRRSACASLAGQGLGFRDYGSRVKHAAHTARFLKRAIRALLGM